MTRVQYLLPVLLCSCLRSPLDPPIEGGSWDEGSSSPAPPLMTTTWESSSGDSGSGTGGETVADTETSSTGVELGSTSVGDSGSTGTMNEKPICTKIQECKFVFVTNEVFAGDLNDLNPDGACNKAASTAKVKAQLCPEGNCDYRALVVREENINPLDLASMFGGKYITPSGVLISEGIDGLRNPSQPPNENEFGEFVYGWVWTGIDPDGDTPENCCHNADHKHWSNDTPEGSGWVGLVGGAGEGWRTWLFGKKSCDTQAHLYCVQA